MYRTVAIAAAMHSTGPREAPVDRRSTEGSRVFALEVYSRMFRLVAGASFLCLFSRPTSRIPIFLFFATYNRISYTDHALDPQSSHLGFRPTSAGAAITSPRVAIVVAESSSALPHRELVRMSPSSGTQTPLARGAGSLTGL